MVFLQVEVKRSLARLETKLDSVVQLINTTQVIEDSEANQDRIIFSAIRKDGREFNGLITYNDAPINVRNAMDIRTNTFVCRRSAYYTFSVSAMSEYNSRGQTEISVLKNDALLFKITDGMNVDNANNMAYQWVQHMYLGDRLKLSVTGHKLFSDYARMVHFNGFTLVNSFSTLNFKTLP